MNFIVSPILKLVAGTTIVLGVLGYINVLRSDNNALEASVERLKLTSEHYTSVANQNAELLKEQQEDYEQLMLQYESLQKQIADVSNHQQIKEKEVVKYVSQLPEGFEKQCLNMSVPAGIGRVQNN